MTKPNYLPAQYIYRLTGVSERHFHTLVRTKQIKYIELFKNGRLYLVKDWDAKVKETQRIAPLLDSIAC